MIKKFKQIVLLLLFTTLLSSINLIYSMKEDEDKDNEYSELRKKIQELKTVRDFNKLDRNQLLSFLSMQRGTIPPQTLMNSFGINLCSIKNRDKNQKNVLAGIIFANMEQEVNDNTEKLKNQEAENENYKLFDSFFENLKQRPKDKDDFFNNLNSGLAYELYTSTFFLQYALDALTEKDVEQRRLESVVTEGRNWHYLKAFVKSSIKWTGCGVSFYLTVKTVSGLLSRFTAAYFDRLKGNKTFAAALEQVKSNDNLKNIILSKEAKDFLQKLIELNKNGMPNHIFLIGAPGTGKTLIGRALGNELKKSVYLITKDMLQIGGKTAENLKYLFEKLGQQNCILIFDEFDSIIKDPSLRTSLQSYLDGVKSMKATIIGTSNIDKISMLRDFPAMIRPGRFIMKEIGLPNGEETKKLIELYSSINKISFKEEDFNSIFKLLEHKSGATINQILKALAAKFKINPNSKVAKEINLSDLEEILNFYENITFQVPENTVA